MLFGAPRAGGSLLRGAPEAAFAFGGPTEATLAFGAALLLTRGGEAPPSEKLPDDSEDSDKSTAESSTAALCLPPLGVEREAGKDSLADSVFATLPSELRVEAAEFLEASRLSSPLGPPDKSAAPTDLRPPEDFEAPRREAPEGAAGSLATAPEPLDEERSLLPDGPEAGGKTTLDPQSSSPVRVGGAEAARCFRPLAVSREGAEAVDRVRRPPPDPPDEALLR